jgi:hypothetical protein
MNKTFYAIGTNAMMFPPDCGLRQTRMDIPGKDTDVILDIFEGESLIPDKTEKGMLENLDEYLFDLFTSKSGDGDAVLPSLTTGRSNRLRVGDILYVLTVFFGDGRNEIKRVIVTKMEVFSLRNGGQKDV